MRTSLAGIKLISDFEGLRLTAYKDIAGILTIGYGHTAGVKIGMKITAAQAVAFLQADLIERELQIMHVLKVAAMQNQFDAMMSFVYNLGIGNFNKSGVLLHFNAGEIQQAADTFLHWNMSNGVVVAGLTRRRIAERAMFLVNVAPTIVATTPVTTVADATVDKPHGFLGWIESI